jgi:ribose 5-phosphate isomerase B
MLVAFCISKNHTTMPKNSEVLVAHGEDVKIYIGADHNGFRFKQLLVDFLKQSGYELVDDGDAALDQNDDFPQYAAKVVGSLRADPDTGSRGILICGSGQGMCMAANRFKGIRASICWNVEEARSARNDDDSNILCLSSRYLTIEETKPIVMAWLVTAFAGAGRFKRRIRELDELE